MIKDIKLGIAMMQNGLTYVHGIFAFLIAVGASIIFAFLLPVPMLSGLFIAVGVLGVVQQVYTVTVSTMVQSSPYKKKLRTTIPAYIAGIVLVIGNTMCLVMHWLAYLRVKDNTEIYLMLMEYDSKEYANSMIICATFMVLFLLFTVLANVFFKLSILVCIGIWIWFRVLNTTIEFVFWDISIETGIVLSYVVVLIGSIVLYGVNCLIYKFEYSELSYRGAIKRASEE